jgi:hypothetical protein
MSNQDSRTGSWVRWLTLAGAALGLIIALIVLILSITPITRPFVEAHGELVFALWPLSLALTPKYPVIAAFVVMSNAIWYGALGLALALLRSSVELRVPRRAPRNSRWIKRAAIVLGGLSALLSFSGNAVTHLVVLIATLIITVRLQQHTSPETYAGHVNPLACGSAQEKLSSRGVHLRTRRVAVVGIVWFAIQAALALSGRLMYWSAGLDRDADFAPDGWGVPFLRWCEAALIALGATVALVSWLAAEPPDSSQA